MIFDRKIRLRRREGRGWRGRRWRGRRRLARSLDPLRIEARLRNRGLFLGRRTGHGRVRGRLGGRRSGSFARDRLFRLRSWHRLGRGDKIDGDGFGGRNPAERMHLGKQQNQRQSGAMSNGRRRSARAYDVL